MHAPTGWHVFRPADLGRRGKQYFRKADFFGAEVWLTESAALGALQFLAAQGWLKTPVPASYKTAAGVGMLRGCLAEAGARLVAESGEVGKREKCVAPATALA